MWIVRRLNDIEGILSFLTVQVFSDLPADVTGGELAVVAEDYSRKHEKKEKNVMND